MNRRRFLKALAMLPALLFVPKVLEAAIAAAAVDEMSEISEVWIAFSDNCITLEQAMPWREMVDEQVLPFRKVDG